MNPWLLAAIVGGIGLWLYEKNKKPSVQAPVLPYYGSHTTTALQLTPYLPSALSQMSIAPGVTEKFEDPFWECFGPSPEATWGQPSGPPVGIFASVDLTTGQVRATPPPAHLTAMPYTIYDNADAAKWVFIFPPTGYEYLANVPNINTARIAAIQSKIAAGPGPQQNWGGRSTLSDVAAQSAQALSSIGQYVYKALRDPASGTAFLAQYAQGVSAADIASEKENLRQIYRSGSHEPLGALGPHHAQRGLGALGADCPKG